MAGYCWLLLVTAAGYWGSVLLETLLGAMWNTPYMPGNLGYVSSLVQDFSAGVNPMALLGCSVLGLSICS